MKVRRRSAGWLAIVAFLAVAVASAGQGASAANVSLVDTQRQLGVLGDSGQHVHWAPTTDPSMANMKMAQPAAAAQLAASPLPASVGGQWTYINDGVPPQTNSPHMIVGPGGKELHIVGSGNSQTSFKAGTFRTYLVDPATGTTKQISTPDDVFCAGHLLSPDGRYAIILGGTASYSPFKGTNTAYAFDFVTESYVKLAPMSVGRWYPSLINTSRGTTLVVSGLNENGVLTSVTEVFDPTTMTTSVLNAPRAFPLYPIMYEVSPDVFFFAGNGTGGYPPGLWTPYSGNGFTAVPGMSNAKQRVYPASCFIGDYRNKTMMLMGGGNGGAVTATSSTLVIDLKAAHPAYTRGPPLPTAKMYPNCLVYPNGQVIELGGGYGNTVTRASSEVSLLSSLGAGWTAMNPLPPGENRLYHNLAWFRPDWTIVSETSNPTDGPWSTSVLLFTSPFAFRGEVPTITSIPSALPYGATLPVGTTVAAGAGLAYISLQSKPSTTHSTNLDQRLVQLPVVNGQNTIPNDRVALPPAMYVASAVDDTGRFSNAWDVVVK